MRESEESSASVVPFVNAGHSVLESQTPSSNPKDHVSEVQEKGKEGGRTLYLYDVGGH